MQIFEIILIGISLAMDAFAISVCKGLSMKEVKLNKVLIISTYFGIFQMIMPIIGFYIGTAFNEIIQNIDHWIAFSLLLSIGINMIKESFKENKEEKNDKTDVKTMIILAIATSIDALAVGIAFAFLERNILFLAAIIGAITFILCTIGVKLGNKFTNKIQNKAEILGGVVLIIIGLKILLEHLSIL